LSLKTKVDGLSVVWPQNHWDGLSVVWPQNHWDGFLRFDLKTGGDVFSRFDLKTGGDGFSRFGLKTDGFGFPGLGLNQAGYGLLVVPQNRWREDGTGHASRSSGLLRLDVSCTRVFQSDLKTCGGITMGGARGIITEVASSGS
jgi:hypothetical protein